MRPVAFGEPLPGGTRLTLVSDDKPDRFFTVIKFWMDETSGVALALKTSVPSYQVEDEEGRTHLLIHLPVMFEASSDAKYRTAFATSSASPRRPSGTVRVIPCSKAAMASSVGANGDQMGVLVAPGVT